MVVTIKLMTFERLIVDPSDLGLSFFFFGGFNTVFAGSILLPFSTQSVESDNFVVITHKLVLSIPLCLQHQGAVWSMWERLSQHTSQIGRGDGKGITANPNSGSAS